MAEEARSYIAFSLAVDESIDNSDTAHLSIFIRGVKSDLSVTEELGRCCHARDHNGEKHF